MTIATTSKIAYKDINEDGTVLTQKDKIVEIMNILPDGTYSLRELKYLTGFDINAVSGRVNELKKDGILETTTKRKCKISKRLISPVIIKT